MDRLADALCLALPLVGACLAVAATSGYAQGPEAYTEDFDDALAQGWELEPGWGLEDGMLIGSGDAWARYTDVHWGEGRFVMRFRLVDLQGGMHVNVHVNGPDRYAVGFRRVGEDLVSLYLFKQRGDILPSSTRETEVLEYDVKQQPLVEIVTEAGDI